MSSDSPGPSTSSDSGVVPPPNATPSPAPTTPTNATTHATPTNATTTNATTNATTTTNATPANATTTTNAATAQMSAAANEEELPRNVVIATMAGVVAAMLLGALDSTIVGTAMPKVIAELHGFEHYAAVTTIYMLTSTTVVPIVGKLSDLYGRKIFLLAGVLIFVVGSALCGFAQDMPQLVAFRGLQGIGAGFSQAMAFTTIADLFPPARRGRISGIMGGVMGISSVVGPAVGGFLTDGPGWRWCFFVNIPVGIIAFVILLVSFPPVKRTRTTKPRIDWLGALVLVLGSVSLLLGLSWAGRDYAWDSWQTESLLGGGVALTIAFVFVELRAPEAIMPPRLFQDRTVATTTIAATLVALAMFGSTVFFPLFIQGVAGTSATKSGAVITPMMFAMIASSITSGQIMTRTGRYKGLAVIGIGIATVGMWLLAEMDVDTTYARIVANMIVLGVGLGATMPVLNLAVQNAVDAREVGVATSALQFMRSMGGSIGAAIFGAILSNRFSPALHDALKPDDAARLPPQLLAQLENPQLLMNPQVAAKLKSIPGIDAALAALKTALASSLHDVFFVATVVVAVGVVAALFIKDMPLRKTNRMTPVAPE